MLDIQFIREHKDQVQDSATKRQVKVDVDELLKLDDQRRELIGQVEELRRQRNAHAAGLQAGKPTEEQIKQGKELKDQTGAAEAKLNDLQTNYQELMLTVPNLLHESVPSGDEQANEVVKTVGDKPEFDFEVKDHETLGVSRDLIDLETAAQTSGARFYYLKGDLVLLQFALTQWVLNKLSDKDFTPVLPPTLVREQMMQATGFFPAERNEIYHVNPKEDDLYLVGTAEVPLAGLHMFEPLDIKDTPKRYIGYSTAYRREAGSYGKDTKGIFRVHQFDKLEMYSFVKPEDSWQEHDFLLSVEEEILQELELHYQVVNIASGDLGAPAAKKYDCEVWIPSQQRYRELTSCSNTTDYQARRGGIKLKGEDGLQYAHTLNGTAMASTRTLIAIMENYQLPDGRIRVPDVLKPYLNGKDTI